MTFNYHKASDYCHVFDTRTLDQLVHTEVEQWCIDNLPNTDYSIQHGFSYDYIAYSKDIVHTIVRIRITESAVAFKLRWC